MVHLSISMWINVQYKYNFHRLKISIPFQKLRLNYFGKKKIKISSGIRAHDLRTRREISKPLHYAVE